MALICKNFYILMSVLSNWQIFIKFRKNGVLVLAEDLLAFLNPTELF